MTKRPRPLATTKLQLSGGHVLVVRIWKEAEQVQWGGEDETYNGLYTSEWVYAVDKTGSIIIKRSKLFIDLVLGSVGAALWAHELQHFMVDWCDRMRWDATESPWDEMAANMAGDLTYKFWKWFYKKFPNTAFKTH